MGEVQVGVWEVQGWVCGRCWWVYVCLIRERWKSWTSTAPQVSSPQYKTVLCQQFMEGTGCQFGDSCAFAHGQAEVRFQISFILEQNICFSISPGVTSPSAAGAERAAEPGAAEPELQGQPVQVLHVHGRVRVRVDLPVRPRQHRESAHWHCRLAPRHWWLSTDR